MTLPQTLPQAQALNDLCSDDYQGCSYSNLGTICVLNIFREDLCSFHYRQAQAEAQAEAEERRSRIEASRSRIESLIRKIRTQRLNKLDFLEDYKMTEKEDCCICLDSIEKNTTIKKISCNHHFHPECLNKWMNQNKNPKCPLCRQDTF